MNNQNFYCDIKDLKHILKDNNSKIIEFQKLEKGIDLRELNEIVKKNNKLYNFSIINNNHLIKENKRKVKKNKNYKILDLFCGAGGFSKGFEMSGFEVHTGIDINKIFIKTHEINFPKSSSLNINLSEADPKELNLKKGFFDVIIGSPPCQTFSSVGQGKIKSLNKNIKNDLRNYLYFSYIKFIEFFAPKFFLLENVPGFKTKYNSEIFNDFVNKLKTQYNISHKIIDAKDFGVPQSRKRLFIFGQNKNLNKNLDLFKDDDLSAKKVTVKDAISDLPNITDDWRLDSLFYSKNENLNEYQKKMRQNCDRIVANNICRVSNEQAKKLFTFLKPGQKYFNLSEKDKKKIKLLKNFKSTLIHQRIKRLPLDDICWTIIAHIGMDGYEYIHPIENRTLSVREAARIQGFPDEFVFTGNMREQYIQVGNSVSPLVSEYFGKKIFNFLSNSK